MYELIIEKKVVKAISRIHPDHKEKIKKAISDLATNPFPEGCIKLKELKDNRFRIPVGNYRVAYEIRKKELVVLILKVSTRQNFYNNL